jgi:hypothetical protein
MPGSRLVTLPLDLERDTRQLDQLTARAVRLALWPGLGVDEPAAALAALAGGDVHLLSRARGRIDRALAMERSRVAERAAVLLDAAIAGAMKAAS